MDKAGSDEPEVLLVMIHSIRIHHPFSMYFWLTPGIKAGNACNDDNN